MFTRLRAPSSRRAKAGNRHCFADAAPTGDAEAGKVPADVCSAATPKFQFGGTKSPV
jgi:hypothetical protein